MHRYIFPDGEMQEISTVAASLQQAGFEVRHTENLREHYALTLRRGTPTYPFRACRAGGKPGPASCGMAGTVISDLAATASSWH